MGGRVWVTKQNFKRGGARLAKVGLSKLKGCDIVKI